MNREVPEAMMREALSQLRAAGAAAPFNCAGVMAPNRAVWS